MPNIINTNITYIPPIKNYKPTYRKPAPAKPPTNKTYQNRTPYEEFLEVKTRDAAMARILANTQQSREQRLNAWEQSNTFRPVYYEPDSDLSVPVAPGSGKHGTPATITVQPEALLSPQGWNNPSAWGGYVRQRGVNANYPDRTALIPIGYRPDQAALAFNGLYYQPRTSNAYIDSQYAQVVNSYADTGGYQSNTTVPTTRNPVNANTPFSQWNSQWNMQGGQEILGPWQSRIAQGVFSRPFRSVQDFDQSVAAMGLQPRYSTTASIPLRDPWAPDPYEGGGVRIRMKS